MYMSRDARPFKEIFQDPQNVENLRSNIKSTPLMTMTNVQTKRLFNIRSLRSYDCKFI